MIWLAFAAGFVLGVFTGVLVLGLIRELGASRLNACSKEPMPEGPPAVAGALGTQVPSRA